MKLSPDHIAALKKLIAFKGYDEIDVQYEILDHVACRVEVLLEENPKLSLEDAFSKTHSEFGVFGFADLADSYRESIRKKFWSRYWTFFRRFFLSYRIVYLFILGESLIILSEKFTLFGEKITAPAWGVIALMISVVFLLVYYHRKGRKFKNYATFKAAMGYTGWMLVLMHISLQGIKYLTGSEIPTELTIEGVMAWLTITAMAIGWVSIFLLPKVIQEAAQETQRLKNIYEA